MDPVAITVGVSWMIIGLLTIVLAIPLVHGEVGRNAVYGARFRESFESDEAWSAINRYSGRQAIIWSLPLVGVGVASLFLPLQTHVTLTLILGFAPLVLLLIPAFLSWRFARRRKH
jgi:SdpI/YfhL protein family